MNLDLADALLIAADGHPHGFLKVHSGELVREVEQMAAAGLVDATLGETDTEAYAVINRVSDSGHAFLRAFTQPPQLADLPTAER